MDSNYLCGVMKSFSLIFMIVLILLTWFFTCFDFGYKEVEVIQSYKVKEDIQKKRSLEYWKLYKKNLQILSGGLNEKD